MFERISLNDVTRAAIDAMAGQSIDHIREQVATSGTTLNVVSRMVRRYMSAERYAAQHTSLVGVGVITFAECRLARFANLCAARGISFYN
jgi:phosphoglycolate phosphatase-like HAD superfamily hydrolase